MIENHFKNKMDKIDGELVRGILNSYFDFAVDEFNYSLIKQGYENLSIRVQTNSNKHLLRIYNEKQFDQHLRNRVLIEDELNFMNLCSSNDLPVPKIIKTMTGELLASTKIDKTEHFVALFEFVSGIEIKIFKADQIKAVARLQAKMHLLSSNFKFKAPHPIDGYFNHQNWLKYILKDFKSNIHSELFNQYLEFSKMITLKLTDLRVKRLRMQPIHADIHEGNMHFVGNKISGLFDFDDCHNSIISEDIGMFLSNVLKKGNLDSLKNTIKIYFDEYKKVSPLSNFEEQLSLYFAIEKRLIPRIDDLKDDIVRSSINALDYEQALEQMKKIFIIAEEYSS